MPQFDTSTYSSQLFWLAVCFTTLTLAMSFWLIPRLQRTLKQRESLIQEDKQRLQAVQNNIEYLKKTMDKELHEAQQKASNLIYSGLKDIEKSHKKQLSEYDHKLQEKLIQFEKDLNLEAETIRSELQNNVEDYANLLEKKLIQASLPDNISPTPNTPKIRKMIKKEANDAS